MGGFSLLGEEGFDSCEVLCFISSLIIPEESGHMGNLFHINFGQCPHLDKRPKENWRPVFSSRGGECGLVRAGRTENQVSWVVSVSAADHKQASNFFTLFSPLLNRVITLLT